MKIAVYSFATTSYFFRELISLARAEGADIDWSVVLPRGHYVELFQGLVAPEKRVYLYEDFNARYEQMVPPYPFAFPREADNVYLSLAKDKDGYRYLEKEEQLRRAATIYVIYKEFLQKVRPDYLLFPDVEAVDGFILINLCYELGIEPIYYVGTRLLGGAFFSSSCHEELPRYFGGYGEGDLQQAVEMLRKVEQSGVKGLRELPGAEKQDLPVIRRSSLPVRIWQSARRAAGKERYYIGEDNVRQKIMTNIIPVIYWYRRHYFRFMQTRFFDITDNGAVSSLTAPFVLYALQYTPESSINGLEPYYVDQTRAIDRLLFGLPNGYVLLVKEHFAMAGIRTNRFYEELRKRPGVVLVHPDVDTQALLQRSTLVATVTGTIGLECFLLDKPCLVFGRNFFSHLCYSAANWGSNRSYIGDIISDFQPRSFDEKAIELAKLLNISYRCKLGDPMADLEILSKGNVLKFLGSLKNHIERWRQA